MHFGQYEGEFFDKPRKERINKRHVRIGDKISEK